MMKIYNVSLANECCIFDHRDGFETAREAVEFACGRGGKYKVYIDAGKCGYGYEINATHMHNGAFAVSYGWDYELVKYFSADDFVKYVEEFLK